MSVNLPNLKDTIIATGYNCHVRIGTGPGEGQCKVVALVSSFQANEDFQVQDATVLGNLGPVSIDPQGYNCSITIDGFLPAKGTLGGEAQYADGGTEAIIDYVPERRDFMSTAGGVGSAIKFEYLDFYNKREGKVIVSFSGIIVTNNGISGDGNAYVKNNVQLRALSWDKPKS